MVKKNIITPHNSFYIKVVVVAIMFGLIVGTVSLVTFRLGGALLDSKRGISPSILNKEQVVGTAVSTATAVSNVSEIVDNVMPAIVQVTNMSVVEYRGFFGQIYRQPSESAGSGIIIADDGSYIYIATNNHVVENSSEISITFSGEEVVAAELQGAYKDKDLAVVKVAKNEISKETLESLKIATIANSESIRVGQGAIAIGNALGYGQSVTTGIISALNREVILQEDYTGRVITNKLIQTDAAINPGNSGGALLNMKGEVIGIVSVKFSDTSVEGMGYAIPISEAMKVIDSIITKGSAFENKELI